MTPAGSQSIGTMDERRYSTRSTICCDPSGVRSTHSLLGLGHDPSGVTEHRNDRRTKVFDPQYGGSQRRRDSPALVTAFEPVDPFFMDLFSGGIMHVQECEEAFSV